VAIFCFFNFFSLSGELVFKTQGICDGIFPSFKKKIHKMAKVCDQTKITASFFFFFFVFLAFFIGETQILKLENKVILEVFNGLK
jgi:hypothetical protein